MKTTPTESFYIKTSWKEYEEMLILDTPHKCFNPSSQSHESSGFYYDKIYVNIEELDWPE
jgi:hypothetical protein